MLSEQNLYLRIAPELYLKRLVVGGMERVFEINRSFRNEGISTQHNPEFTMLEFYQAYATYKDLMDLTEEMLSEVVRSACGNHTIPYQGETLDFTPPGRRIGLRESLSSIGGFEAEFLQNPLEMSAYRNQLCSITAEKLRETSYRPVRAVIEPPINPADVCHLLSGGGLASFPKVR
jgi:lysyl-tRNA synthetase class 2